MVVHQRYPSHRPILDGNELLHGNLTTAVGHLPAATTGLHPWQTSERSLLPSGDRPLAGGEVVEARTMGEIVVEGRKRDVSGGQRGHVRLHR